MNRNRSLAVMLLTVAGLLAAAPVHAGHPRYAQARVVDVQPVYVLEQVPVERQVCWQGRGYRAADPTAGAIAGAVVGGVIGHQFGDGRGQRALTLAGAAIGAAVGHEATSRHGRYRAPVQRCGVEVHYETREVLAGYDVAYRYAGRIHHTRMAGPPGRFIEVEVDVRPAR